MKNVISATVFCNGNGSSKFYRVVYTDTADTVVKERVLNYVTSKQLESYQQQTSLLLWIYKVIPQADQAAVISKFDSILDLENELGFDRGLDAAVEAHND